jgi:hypothetical protein
MKIISQLQFLNLFYTKWTEQCVSYTMWRTGYIRWDDDDVRFILDKHTLQEFYFACSRKLQSADTPIRYPDSEPTSLCSDSLRMRD